MGPQIIRLKDGKLIMLETFQQLMRSYIIEANYHDMPWFLSEYYVFAQTDQARVYKWIRRLDGQMQTELFFA